MCKVMGNEEGNCGRGWSKGRWKEEVKDEGGEKGVPFMIFNILFRYGY